MKPSAIAVVVLALLALLVCSTSPPPASSQPRDPVSVAREHLRGNAHRYGLRPELDDLSLVETEESRGAWHVRFRQTFRGIPLFGALTTVNISKADSHVSSVLNRYRSDVESNVKPALPRPLLSEEEAVGIARVALGLQGEPRAPVTAEQVYFLEDPQYVLAWQVLVPALQPLGDWLVVVQADDGRVLHKQNLVVFDSGRVFDPNPAQTSGGTIPPPSDCDSAANASLLASQYRTKTLLGIDAAQNKLKGQYVDMCAPSIDGAYKPACQANEASRNYIYSCNDDRYEEVMVYHHLDAVQRKIQSLGFIGASAILDQPISAHAHYFADANAFYSPADGGLHFGDGSVSEPVDVAEDADVIVHEYGHAIQDFQVPGFGIGYYWTIEEAGSIGEGFADFLAGATFDDPCIGEWMNGGTCLRSLDNTNHFPEDFDACPMLDLSGNTVPETVEPHCGGLVWGGALWDLVEAFGGNQEARDLALTLALDSHFYLDPVATFQEAVSAVRQADLDLFDGAHVPTINAAFAARGLLTTTPGVSEEWMARYKGPRTNYDAAEDIAVDSAGNVFVTGASSGPYVGTDWATLKHTPSGDLAWAERWAGSGGGDDAPYAIALDGSGGVGVTGQFYNSSYWTIDRATRVWATDWAPPAQPPWVYYSYSVNRYGDDVNSDITLDTAGNAYITGTMATQAAGYDYVTEELIHASGTPWKVQYNGPANGHDVAVAIARDGSGNVWVTGYSEGVATGYDYATVKYSSSGTQVCVARYNGPTGGDDYAQALAVDSSGNAYVTGYSQGSGTNYDYATVKYDPSCNQLWPDPPRYNGPGNGYDRAQAIAVDAGGNVYVTGYSQGSGTGYDYATLKYSSTGSQLWPAAARYDGPGHGDDFSRDLALDTSNNVLVTGESVGAGTSSDYTTLKYSSGGSQLWEARYDGPASDSDGAVALAVDAGGTVYVTGHSTAPLTGYDYLTLKYSASGSELWEARYTGWPGYGGTSVRGQAIAIDGGGNVYVAGDSEESGGEYDYLVLKYSPNGEERWRTTYNGPPGDGADIVEALAVDGAGNVYVTGLSEGVGTGFDILTVKYDTNGNQLWPEAARWDGPNHGHDSGNAIGLCSDGSVYVTGESRVGATWAGASDYVTIKYDRDGNEVWARLYDGPGPGSGYDDDDVAYDLVVDVGCNVYVTGKSYGSGSYGDYATVKYSPDGTRLWVAEYEGPGKGQDVAEAIVLDSDGNVWVTGHSPGWGAAGMDYATVKYAAGDGRQLCAGRYSTPGDSSDYAHAIAADEAGSVYVTGQVGGWTSDNDYATVKYDPNCVQQWAATYDGPPGPGDDSDMAYAIAVDSGGKVYVTGGSKNGTDGFMDYATVAYDAAGNQLWLARYDGVRNPDQAADVAVDGQGKVYVTGYSYGRGTFRDIVTIKYAPEADSDGDGISDSVDNCRLIPNTDQMDGDGDRLGNACDNCPDVANALQTNTDGDQWGDACDYCPTTATSWEVPAGDQDCDGFTSVVEGYVGTDPLDACPDDPADDAWPLDISMDRYVTVVGDALNFRGRIGATPGSPDWLQRLDFNMDDYITVVGDALMYRGMIGETCT